MMDSIDRNQDEGIWAIIDGSNGIIKPDGQKIFSEYVGSQQYNRPLFMTPMAMRNLSCVVQRNVWQGDDICWVTIRSERWDLFFSRVNKGKPVLQYTLPFCVSTPYPFGGQVGKT